MAVSSLSVTPLSLSNSSPSLSSKPKFPSLCFLSGNNTTLRVTCPKPLHSSTVVHVATEALDSSPDPLDPPPETLDDDSDATTFEVCVCVRESFGISSLGDRLCFWNVLIQHVCAIMCQTIVIVFVQNVRFVEIR